MTEYAWDVLVGKRRAGTADVDPDLVAARVVAGKAAYRAGVSQRGGIALTHEALLLRLAVDQVVVSHANPDKPMQARKLAPGKQAVTRIGDDRVDVPARFRFSESPSVRFDTKRATSETLEWIEAEVSARCPLPPKPPKGASPELLFDRVVRFRHDRTTPLTAERNRTTNELLPVFSEIASVLGVDMAEPWSLMHRPSGLVVRFGGLELSRASALSRYRRHLVKTGQDALLVCEEVPVPARLDIRPYVVDDEDGEIAGLRAHGD